MFRAPQTWSVKVDTFLLAPKCHIYKGVVTSLLNMSSWPTRKTVEMNLSNKRRYVARSYIHCPSLSQIGCHSVFLLLDGPQSLCHMAVLFCHCSVPGSSPILLISALNPHTPLPTLNLFILIKGGRKFYILYRIEKLDYSETHTI